jgi:hypothetical protein
VTLGTRKSFLVLFFKKEQTCNFEKSSKKLLSVKGALLAAGWKSGPDGET